MFYAYDGRTDGRMNSGWMDGRSWLMALFLPFPIYLLSLISPANNVNVPPPHPLSQHLSIKMASARTPPHRAAHGAFHLQRRAAARGSTAHFARAAHHSNAPLPGAFPRTRARTTTHGSLHTVYAICFAALRDISLI